MSERATKAAGVVINDVLNVKVGETVLITRDTAATGDLSALLSAAAADSGACPIEVRMPKGRFPGAPPPSAVLEVARAAHVWVELNEIYLLGTAAHHAAESAGLRRFYSLSGMTIDDLVLLELEIDRGPLIQLGQRLADLTSACGELRVACRHGTDWRASCHGRTAAPDTVTMSLGQTHIAPLAETIEGRLVFDGSAFPPESLGALRGTIEVEFADGRSRVVDSGRESRMLTSWQNGLNDPGIFRLNHFSYGYHPRVAFPTGRLVADERVFGGLCVGFGPEQPYSCHNDLTILDATVYVDGTIIQADGEYIDPELRALAHALGAPGY